MDWIARASAWQLARTAGGLYLVNIVFGAFAIGVVPAIVVVAGDASTTAHNIQTHELLYRISLAAHVVVVATNVPLAVIFYELFKVVNRRLALLMAFSSLLGTAVETANLVNQFTPLLLLGGQYSSALPPQQLNALAYIPIDLQGIGYDMSAVFFGFYALSVGFLIYRSTFMPRAIGVLMVIDGVSYLVYSFADFIAPGFAAHLVPWAQLPILLGEGSFCLWMLIAGVNVRRWNDLASHAGALAAGTA